MTIEQLRDIVAEAMSPSEIGDLLDTQQNPVEETVDLYVDSPVTGYRGMVESTEGLLYVWDLYKTNNKWEFLAQPM